MEAAGHTLAAPKLVPRRPPWSVRRRRLLVAVADHSILIALAIAFLAPFVFMVLTGFMTNQQALSTNLWPQPFRASNFSHVFDVAPILRYGLNSFLYAGLATLGDAPGAGPNAPRLPRQRRFPGSNRRLQQF